MESNKKYWKGLEELNKTPEFVEKNKHEFAEPIPIEDILEGDGLKSKTPRRDFLKTLGFGVGAVSLAACQKVPVHKSIPYLIKPEEITPGLANFYVSSYEGQAILVKTREGRPIKIEGNPNDIFGKGGTSAGAQASVLELYDSSRLKGPLQDGGESGWDAIDTYIKNRLATAKSTSKGIRLVTSSINSPSTLGVIADFVTAYPTAKHVVYDAVSYTGIIQANQNSFGKAVLPHYNFDKADVIVSFGADFLGGWISHTEFSRQYAANRAGKALEEKKMSRHIHFETGMSLTGSNADVRMPVKPSEEGTAIISLYNALTGGSLGGGKKVSDSITATAITLAAKELMAAKGRALVVSGSNDVATQILVNAINSLLGSYGATIDLDNPSKQFAGNDAAIVELVSEMNRGDVDCVFFMGSNPVYDYYDTKAFKAALAKTKLLVSLSPYRDETAAVSNISAPQSHYLETWGDGNAAEGYYTIIQPTINPVYDTRPAEQSLLIWANAPVKDYYTYVRNTWEKNIMPLAGLSGQAGWEKLLQTGYIKANAKPAGTYTFSKDLNAVVQTIAGHSSQIAANGDYKLELQIFESPNIGDGKKANNPWLQELPDPVTKVTWDNFAAIAVKTAQKWGLEEGDWISISANGYTIELPILYQPGQAQGTISVAVGYGRTKAGKVGDGVGKNAFPFATYRNGTFQNSIVADVKKTGALKYVFAQTQTHHSYEGRNSIIKEGTLAQYIKNPESVTGKGEGKENYDLWNEYERPAYNWVMAIDLNACTGCGSCIVACTAENNVPVVGREEVRNRREMHWLRIDRYYSFSDAAGNNVTKEKEINKLDDLDHVQVTYQPMLCQHCDHAPCETVCPVLATTHSSEGLNMMTYNRCVGTRYCANNCPYKVRRFNWFNYWNDSRFENYIQNEYTELVLNPDVTTRFRGVMEKCSMCVQRIQAGKLKAKLEKRPLVDGEIKMACQQSCPTNAIVFGNLNDPKSEVAKALKSERTYYVLEELNVKPGVGYQAKIRNTTVTGA